MLGMMVSLKDLDGLRWWISSGRFNQADRSHPWRKATVRISTQVKISTFSKMRDTGLKLDASVGPRVTRTNIWCSGQNRASIHGTLGSVPQAMRLRAPVRKERATGSQKNFRDVAGNAVDRQVKIGEVCRI